MWESIGYVSSAFTLVAFIIAAAIWIYRKSLLQKERLIRQAPEQDRAELVESALEIFHVDTVGLTKQQQYNLALRQIHARALRFRLTALVVVVIAILATSISMFALLREGASNSSNGIEPSPTAAPLTSPQISEVRLEPGVTTMIRDMNIAAKLQADDNYDNKEQRVIIWFTYARNPLAKITAGDTGNAHLTNVTSQWIKLNSPNTVALEANGIFTVKVTSYRFNETQDSVRNIDLAVQK